MTDYSIRTTNNEYFVTKIDNGKGVTAGGPYATEEKAKRRIRDLKRANAAKHIADGDIGGTLITANVARDLPVHVDCPKRCLPRGQAAFRKYSATNGGYGKFNTEPREYDDAWVAETYCVMDTRKPRNGYRPAHRANRFRSAR